MWDLNTCPPERWYPTTPLHGVITQKTTWIFTRHENFKHRMCTYGKIFNGILSFGRTETSLPSSLWEMQITNKGRDWDVSKENVWVWNLSLPWQSGLRGLWYSWADIINSLPPSFLFLFIHSSLLSIYSFIHSFIPSSLPFCFLSSWTYVFLLRPFVSILLPFCFLLFP
jgi:hypothetical protein